MTDAFDPADIVAMERAALDRWGAGDPQGYLEIMAPGVTYFDPVQPRRVVSTNFARLLFHVLSSEQAIVRCYVRQRGLTGALECGSLLPVADWYKPLGSSGRRLPRSWARPARAPRCRGRCE